MSKPRISDICLADNCSKPHYARGYCCAHYQALRNSGALAPLPEYPQTCSVEGCSEKPVGQGLCRKHYSRFRSNGDTTTDRRQEYWERARVYYRDVVLPYRGDACLTWPFNRDADGYARMQLAGKSVKVHRQACSDTYGPPPSEDYVCAHLCGNGHLGCVAPNHTEFCTSADNAHHKHLHGTAPIGERNPKAKFTEDDIRQIRKLRDYLSAQSVAHLFSTSSSYIEGIWAKRHWRHLD